MEKKPLRVLVVEDSEDDALLMIRELERGGYDMEFERVETSGDMEAALKNGKWDIILSDYQMPKFSGTDALELLKKSGQEIPFVLISGRIGEDVAVAAIKAGAHDYIMKDNLTRLPFVVDREMREYDARREKKRIEAALHESEERYRNLVELAGAGIGTVDTDFRLTYVNEHLAAMTGYERDELVGSMLWDFFSNEERRITEERLKKGTFGARDIKLMKKDGNDLFIQMHTSPLKDPDGNYTGLMGIMIDINERKRMEDELRSSLAHYTAIVDSTNAIVLEVDGENNIVFANSECMEIIESECGGLKDCSLSKLFEARFNDELKGRMVSVLKEGMIDQYESELDLKGGRMDVVISLVPITVSGESSHNILIIIRDISELKAVENIKMENLALVEANRLKSEFMASMSHDLRTPLNAVIGYSELLKDHAYGELNEKQHEHLEFIYNSGNSLLDLINDILDHESLDAGKLKLNMEQLQLNSIIEDARNLSAPQVNHGNLNLTLELEPGISVWADEVRVRQCLNNLLSNAIKFTPSGGSIVIRAKKTGVMAEVSVIDNGCGISRDKLEIIFQPFYRINIDSDMGGTGLGLAITRNLVNLMGGIVRVESVEGKGSTFSFTIPVTGTLKKKPTG